MTEAFGTRPAAGLAGARSKTNRAAIGILIGLLEIGAIAIAQRWPVAGAVALGALAGLQVIAAVWLEGGLGKLLMLAGTISILVGGVVAATALTETKVEQVASGYTMEMDKQLGWTMEPGGPVTVTKIINGHPAYTQTYTYDDDGFRRTLGAEKGPTVAFFGDSFTLGEGVADAETMPQVFADRTDRKLRVVNAGTSGYSPAQVLRELELGRFDHRFMPAKAMFMLTIDWQAARVACAHNSLVGAPRYESRNGEVRLAGACGPVAPPATLAGRLLMATPLLGKLVYGGALRRVSDEEIQAYIDVVAAIGRLAKSKYGVPLHVLYLRNPSYLVFNRFDDDKIMDEFRKGGVIVYDLTLPQEGRGEFAIPLDGHPTALAQRLHAEMLVDALKRDEPELLNPGAQSR